MADAIAVRGLVRIHSTPGGGVAALRGVDLDVRSGEIVAIVGPSGSGKSTLLRILAGLEPPSAGSVEMLGLRLDLASRAQLERHRRDRIGLVEQHYRRAVSPYLSVQRAVDLPLALRGASARMGSSRSADLLRRLGLAGRATARRTELSGGQQQRVAVAAALAARPPIVLADEPTGELDETTGADLLTVLRQAVREDGATCLIVTHDALVERFADRVLHLRDGRFVAERAHGQVRRLVDPTGWLAPQIPVDEAAATARSTATRDHAPPIDALDDPPAVVLRGVTRRFGDEGGSTVALPPTDARLAHGGVHVVSGPSGSGKTTLLRLMIGLDRPTAGRVETLGVDLETLDREASARFRARHVGLVDQARVLVPFLSALENVELGLAIRGRPASGRDGREAAWDALGRLDIDGLAQRRPAELSAGERLRVSIARAIASGPSLLVLDEPTSALDRHAAARVGMLLAELAGGYTTVVVATHDPALVRVATGHLRLGLPNPA